jgi:hypothetical protein
MYYHCIVFFDVRTIVLCLIYAAFVGKKIIKIEQESTLE